MNMCLSHQEFAEDYTVTTRYTGRTFSCLPPFWCKRTIKMQQINKQKYQTNQNKHI